MTGKPEDAPTTLVKLAPSKDWLATFWCTDCRTHHHILLLKQRVNFKAFLIENAKAHKAAVNGSAKSTKVFGLYKSRGGAPDDKVLDDIEDAFGPEDDDDDDEDEDDEDDDPER